MNSKPNTVSVADRSRGDTGGRLRTVSVIMPARNEVDHIQASLRAVLDQDYDRAAVEILVADGQSDDGTREEIQAFAREDTRVRLIDNPGRIVSTGLNAAIGEARGEIVIRMDAHTEYAPDYVSQCVRVLEESGADNVGGAWRAVGMDYWQRAIAAGFQSWFSSGGARSHAAGYEGEVDSVYLGCWWRATLLRLGGFDEELVRNQDDEFNLRLRKSGGRIHQSRSIRSWYHPRASLRALFRQYAQYGYWKIRILRKHGTPASIRHVIPGLFLAALIIMSILNPFSDLAHVALCAVTGTYVVANLTASVFACLRAGDVSLLPVLPVVYAMFHLGYGYGSLRGLVNVVVSRRRVSGDFSALTRARRESG